ncbi:MAG: membrane protein insertion efficiency factor YidD [Clostridia bacterium]|nr:membrane protein insertion efficiency factor YidD [Clostridia bacterium]
MKIPALKAIKFYQRYISPHKRACCRYIPTCSEYSYQAIEKYGFIKGGFLSVCRIIRCNPFFKGGYDPLK